jgi:hypothetical protein
VSLSAGTTKLASITQNNHVYEHTAEGPTPEMSLNVRSPYRRQKRDSIIRSSFRRSHTGIEVFTIISITLPFFRSYPLLPIFFYFFATISIISYLSIFLPHYRFFLTFLRPYRLFPTFLPSYDHIDYLLSIYISLTSRR